MTNELIDGIDRLRAALAVTTTDAARKVLRRYLTRASGGFFVPPPTILDLADEITVERASQNARTLAEFRAFIARQERLRANPLSSDQIEGLHTAAGFLDDLFAGRIWPEGNYTVEQFAREQAIANTNLPKCSICHRSMRPALEKADNHPGTVSVGARGLCQTCYRKSIATTPEPLEQEHHE